MTRRKKAPHEEPVHLVLDNEGLGQITAGILSHRLRLALHGAASTSGKIVLPTSVVVERDHDRTSPAAAATNHVLCDAEHDPLTEARAAEAVALRVRSAETGSVVDAHVVAAAYAVIRRFGGTAMVATSDPSDLTKLLDGTQDGRARAAMGVLPL